jgi:hypothetical protein
MRLLGAVVLAFPLWFGGGCASATQTAEDAGVDLSAGNCDHATLFTSCSAQCHEPVCVVSKVMCVGSDYVCDCASVQPCGPDMRQSD